MSFLDKKSIFHEKFYITSFVKNEEYPYLLFAHGGPGLNCGIVEYLIDYENFFNSLNCNLVLYDQRGCGKSSRNFPTFGHSENIQDLSEIIKYLESINIRIKSIIGHSYGAKLLFDFIQETNSNIQPIFVSMGHSIMTPRLNNLTLDLAFIKKNYPDKYQDTISKIKSFNLESIWKLTEELAPLFHENKDRQYFYWANLIMLEKCKAIQEEINLPLNNDVFMKVRKNLYSDETKLAVDISSLTQPYLWINGIHDYINSTGDLLHSKANMILFFQSSHYPHLEENDHFCQLINEFIK